MSGFTSEFFADFQRRTEELWSHATINTNIYGFQFQRGTRWLPGLSEEQLAEFELAVDAKFPQDFRKMLGAINGTDLPTLNLYGNTQAPRESVGVYSYPRHLHLVRERINALGDNRSEIAIVLSEQGFRLNPEAKLIPIFSHRYIVCDLVAGTCPVLSIVGADVIVYGDTLRKYLETEFLRAHTST